MDEDLLEKMIWEIDKAEHNEEDAMAKLKQLCREIELEGLTL